MQTIREAVERAAEGTAVTRVYLFGSQARGDASANSDIDLCLETAPGFSLIDAGIFQDSVSAACGREVDIVSDKYLTPTTRANIRQNRVLVYER